MIHIIIYQFIRSADNIRMAEPLLCCNGFLIKFPNNMFWKSMDIRSIGIFKSCQCHWIFGCELNRLLINDLDSFDAFCPCIYKTVIIHTFKCIQHKCRIRNSRTGHSQYRKNHILCSNRFPVRPGCFFINVDNKIHIIFCSNRICQHWNKRKIFVHVYQWQELQINRIFIDPCLINC